MKSRDEASRSERVWCVCHCVVDGQKGGGQLRSPSGPVTGQSGPLTQPLRNMKAREEEEVRE